MKQTCHAVLFFGYGSTINILERLLPATRSSERIRIDLPSPLVVRMVAKLDREVCVARTVVINTSNTATSARNLTMPKTRISKVVLTPRLAVEIYLLKMKLENLENSSSCKNQANTLKGRSVPVAKKYNVSAKTIRDVWNRRTWSFATESVWMHKQFKVRIVFSNHRSESPNQSFLTVWQRGRCVWNRIQKAKSA